MVGHAPYLLKQFQMKLGKRHNVRLSCFMAALSSFGEDRPQQLLEIEFIAIRLRPAA